MPLVLYPNSDSDSDDQTLSTSAQSPVKPGSTAVKRKHSDAAHDTLPPLPAAFHDLYSTNARVSTSDNPNLHGGRKRAVPHVEGNWPSHVYLEWVPLQTESEGLHALLQHVNKVIQEANKTRTNKLSVPEIVPSLQSELGAPLPLHISLSRTLQIKTEDRQDFLDTLNSSVHRASVRAFSFNFLSLKWVPNFERNRWFLVLSIKPPKHNELNRLLIACNEAAEKCGHPGLYNGGQGDGPMEDNNAPSQSKRRKSSHMEEEELDRSDRFHVSIAWNLDDPDEEWISLVQKVKVSAYVAAPETTFDAVKARVGNVVHKIDLGISRPGLDT